MEDTDHDGNTALIAAAAGGRAKVVQALLAAGASANRQNVYGSNAHGCVAAAIRKLWNYSLKREPMWKPKITEAPHRW